MSDGIPLPRRPPQITVNSGSGGDLLDGMRSDSTVPATPATPGTPGLTRQLLPQIQTTEPVTQRNVSGLPNPYGSSPMTAESAEMLLPPAPSRGGRQLPYQDSNSDLDTPSRAPSTMSRRSSWDSDGDRSRFSQISQGGPFTSPFDDSRAPSRAGSESDDPINTQTVADKYNIMPSAGLLIYPQDIEKDDWLHNPDPNDKDREKCELFTKRGLTNLGGLGLITLGLLAIFIVYPVLTFVERITGWGQGGCSGDCLSDSLPLLKNQRTGLIDPDTPTSAYTMTDHNGDTLKLVFSDEFNTDGRTFYPDDDPYFEAMDIWYGVTEDLEWYDPDAVTTENGTLVLKFDAFQNHNLNYRSGMLQSWNKMCFKGGRVEASLSLPGSGEISGFWPGFWAMGNLGRPGYAATTEGLWPYSYHDECDIGITPNQSSTDGINWLPGMKLPACTCSDQEHPSPGNSRSAPEIDALEAAVGYLGPGSFDNATGTASQSFQAAPFDIWYEPDYDYFEVYDNEQTQINNYRGGTYQHAISGLTWLNNEWYNGNAYQKYGWEYTPGSSGDITWFVGDQYSWHLDARALRPNGNVGQRVVPEEPMALIMNFGMSDSFTTVMLPNLQEFLPAKMRFDYIRIYQVEGEESVTCDPTGYPTTDYISNHPAPYANPNLTTWADTAYDWPTNSFMNTC